MRKSFFYGKIIISLVLAFLISSYLSKKVFFRNSPLIRVSFKREIASLPATLKEKAGRIADYIKMKSKGISLPPPWVPPETVPYPSGAVPGPATVAPPTETPRLPRRKTSPPATSTPPAYPTAIPTSPPYVPTPTATRAPTETPRPTNTPTPTPFPTVTPLPPQNVLTSEERATIDLINQRRNELGRGTLTVNYQLVHAARRHSRDLAERGRCGHTGSDDSDPWRRAKEAGYRGQLYGETVGCGYTTPQAVVDGWWSSPPHREILTNVSVTQIGVGWWDRRQTALVGY